MLKIIKLLLPEKMRFENTWVFPHMFLNFRSDYDLNLCRCLNPKLPPMCDLGPFSFRVRHTFVCVCGTLFVGIRLKLGYLPKQSLTYKSLLPAES